MSYSRTASSGMVNDVNRWMAGALSVALSGVLGGCVTVTQTRTLETEPARTWLSETGDAQVTVASAAEGAVDGRIVSATGGAIHLLAADGSARTIQVRKGTVARQKTRGKAAIVGLVSGLAVGLVVGLVLTQALGAPNQDSAGGVEHPAFMVPIGVLGGALLGTIVGATVGIERRLEVQPEPNPPDGQAHSAEGSAVRAALFLR